MSGNQFLAPSGPILPQHESSKVGNFSELAWNGQFWSYRVVVRYVAMLLNIGFHALLGPKFNVEFGYLDTQKFRLAYYTLVVSC